MMCRPEQTLRAEYRSSVAPWPDRIRRKRLLDALQRDVAECPTKFEETGDGVSSHPHLVHLGSTVTGEDARRLAIGPLWRDRDARWVSGRRGATCHVVP